MGFLILDDRCHIYAFSLWSAKAPVSRVLVFIAAAQGTAWKVWFQSSPLTSYSTPVFLRKHMEVLSGNGSWWKQYFCSPAAPQFVQLLLRDNSTLPGSGDLYKTFHSKATESTFFLRIDDIYQATKQHLKSYQANFPTTMV